MFFRRSASPLGLAARVQAGARHGGRGALAAVRAGQGLGHIVRRRPRPAPPVAADLAAVGGGPDGGLHFIAVPRHRAGSWAYEPIEPAPPSIAEPLSGAMAMPIIAISSARFAPGPGRIALFKASVKSPKTDMPPFSCILSSTTPCPFSIDPPARTKLSGLSFRPGPCSCPNCLFSIISLRLTH